MKKYKRKHHFFISNFIILIVILAFISTISIGYSYWATSLYVNGTVRMVGEIEPGDIEDIVQPIDPGGLEYTELTVTDDALTIQNQQINDNTLTINATTGVDTGKPRSMTLNFKLKNTSKTEPFINGTVTYSLNGNTTFFTTNPATTISNVISPEGTGALSATFSSIKFNKLGTGASCTFTVQYDVGDAKKTFYIVLNIVNNV